MEIKNYCQSCGMPLEDEKLFGTNADGSKNSEQCIYCFENGEYTDPNLTMEGMIEICIPHMVNDGMSESEARSMLNEYLPKLKRWSKN